MTDNGNKNKNPIKDLSNNKVLETIYKKNQLLLKNTPNDNNNPYKHNKLKFNMNRNRTYHYNIKDTLDLYHQNKDYSNKYKARSKKIYKNKNDFLDLIEKLNMELDENIENVKSPFFIPTYKEKIETPLKLPPIKDIEINVEINTLDDIIKLINENPISYEFRYNIDMQSMHNIKEPIIRLNNMIGMNKLKANVINQILYFIQKFHINDVNKKINNDFMHTVIYGPPGTGKTEIAKIMGHIFSKLGVLKNNKFQKVTRTDLIAGYLGQTAIKTTEVIKKCLGGVLFIDEAYALGNSEKRDSFAKECIDTLCEALSDHKSDLMVIIAGYEDDLNKCFFSYNQGLDSRFTWRFKTDDYNSKELFLIFKKKVDEIGWTLEKKITDRWFEEKMEYFKYFGRDMETLLAKIKITHSRRVFCLKKEEKKKIILKDMDNGFDIFLDNDEVKKRNDFKTIEYMYV